MTLEDMLDSYSGGGCITIQDGKDGEKYCEEAVYDYYKTPLDALGHIDEHELENTDCIVKASWWDKIKDREVKRWSFIEGGRRLELYITLLNDEENDDYYNEDGE